MYEVICPACRRMVDAAVHVAVVGAQFKCPKCWTVIEVANDNPLRMVVSKHPQGNIVRSSSSSRHLDLSEADD
jgi:hypothetical protein